MTLRNLLIAGAAAIALALPGAAAADTFAATTTELNLRGGPGTAHGVIAVMPAGSPVTIHQCGGGWCQLTFANRTGWASQRYLDMRVAAAPRTGWRAGPRVGFEVYAGTPRHHWRDWRRPGWYAGWHQPRWWYDRPAGWYGPVYWDRNRWYHGGRWHTSPGFTVHLGFG